MWPITYADKKGWKIPCVNDLYSNYMTTREWASNHPSKAHLAGLRESNVANFHFHSQKASEQRDDLLRRHTIETGGVMVEVVKVLFLDQSEQLLLERTGWDSSS